MPDTLDHIAYLAQEIGPRPAGSEQEQQAALYIADTIQQDAGLHAEVEDFRPRSDGSFVQSLCGIIGLVVVILALALPVMAVPAIIITVLLAVVVLLEQNGHPFVSNMFSGKDSQNIVARYVPETKSSRMRKIVVVAHYDSPKNRKETAARLLPILPIINRAVFIATIALPILLLIRGLFFLNSTGAIVIIVNVLVVLVALVALIPFILSLLARFSDYSEGANCNATGVAVLIEAAMRAGAGARPYARREERADYADSYEDDYDAYDERPIIHGEEAARAAGLIPEGAEISYEYEGEPAADHFSEDAYEPAGEDFETEAEAAGEEPAFVAERPQRVRGGFEEVSEDADPAERLLAAKRAIAALTGRPTSNTISCDLSALREAENAARMAAVGEAPEAFEAAPEAVAPEAEESARPVVAVEPAEAETAVFEPADAFEGLEPAQELVEPEPEPVFDDDPNVPAWFKRAQAKARRNPEEDAIPVKRSQFADALRIAEAVSGARAAVPVAEAVEAPKSELDRRIEDMRDTIAQAPSFHYDRSLLEEVDRVQAEAEAALDVFAQKAEFAPGDEPMLDQAVDSAEALEPAGAEPIAAEPEAEPAAIEAEHEAEPAADVAAAVQNDLSAGETVAMPALDLQGGIPVLQSIPQVVIPEISLDQALPAIEEFSQQPAPLAGFEPQGEASRSALRSTLPSITGSISYVRVSEPAAAVTAAPATGAAGEQPASPASILACIPALDIDSLPSFSTPSGSAGMTGSFAPVGDQILMDAQGEDVYVDDADDSAFEEDFTDQGAYAGEDYVEMPKKQGFLSRLFKKNKDDDLDLSASEWLDIDEDYTANSAGAARGNWESFQPNDIDDLADTAAKKAGDFAEAAEDVFDAGQNPTNPSSDWNNNDWNKSGWGRGWNGGAFSGLKQKLADAKDKIGSRKQDDEAPTEDEHQREDAFEYEERPYQAEDEAYAPAEYEDETHGRPRPRRSSRTQRSIQSFHGLDLDSEVWFVALGSQCSGNAGMKAFLAAHERDLHGALIIELEGLGAGELSYVKKEGVGRPVEASRRALRFLRKAQQTTGLRLAPVDLPWAESASSLAMRRGFSALHLIGAQDGKPAYYGESADTIDNIDLGILAENSDFVMELLKTI